MRTTSLMGGLLLLLAVLWMLASLFLPTAADVAAEHLGQKNIGRAIVPKHEKEQWDREKK